MYMFSAALLSLQIACLEKKTEYKVGQCLNPVDGSQVWKLTKVQPLKGQLFNGQAWTAEAQELNGSRIYGVVPCPQASSN